MNNVKVLQKAKKILETNKWVKGMLAAKANGHTVVSITSSEAKCFCGVGALRKALNVDHYWTKGVQQQACRNLLNRAVCNTTDCDNDFMCFNDAETTKKKDVLKVFDKAIELAKNELKK
jgi:hypothetical protein